ncbi:hypothetical protein [Psychromarinibacter halotolerans]|uniref:Uncharacterized protein n=1 Tax=Psychromarinibacter halotolerans TaxID=1775175 RepID=A0ABV7GJH8_9RHOB|nr:hypothetical protein [Psychromarinibacter halotolerans]MDF0595806.1 hypothetical protein [Psychromarinibacter halotolerans]
MILSSLLLGLPATAGAQGFGGLYSFPDATASETPSVSAPVQAEPVQPHLTEIPALDGPYGYQLPSLEELARMDGNAEMPAGPPSAPPPTSVAPPSATVPPSYVTGPDTASAPPQTTRVFHPLHAPVRINGAGRPFTRTFTRPTPAPTPAPKPIPADTPVETAVAPPAPVMSANPFALGKPEPLIPGYTLNPDRSGLLQEP